MKSETKLFLGIIGATVAVVAAALFLFSRSSPTKTEKADPNILIRSDSYKISTPSATVTLVEFGDFQCPACGTYFPIVKLLVDEFKNNVTFAFRNFPLRAVHPNANVAAQAAEAAGKQGKYWEMFDIIYRSQGEWSKSSDPKTLFLQYAQTLGINLEQMKKDMDDPNILKKIDRDLDDGNTLGVNSTPTFYLNGEKLVNPGSVEDFRTLIKAAIVKAPAPSLSAKEFHTHFNLKIIINGRPMDLSLEKYQSKDRDLDENIHLHDGNGDVVHVHKANVAIGDFLTSLSMSLASDSFMDDLKNKFSNQGENKVKFYVNGQLNSEFSTYQPKDLDKILITYGNEGDAAIADQLKSVADTACIYSEKCPERGKPPTEKCVGGMGTGCKD